jgi:hypothetical protein
MKAPKLILASIALCMSLASFSQTDTTKKDTSSRRDTTSKRDSSFLNSQSSTQSTLQSNSSQPSQSATTQQTQAGTSLQGTSASSSASATSGSSATAHETAPKPNFGRYYIPVLGSYQASDANAENKSVTINGDESNPGKIWIEGVGGSKFYALLKTLPGTYKVPAQTQDANNIQEGTVIYDDATKQINICVGCGFKDANPSEALATNNEPAPAPEKAVKGKNKKSASKAPAKTIITFSGVKADHTTASAQ